MALVCSPTEARCCWIAGVECPLLTYQGDIPRCSVWGKWDEEPYKSSEAAAFYERSWPGRGYTCADWPQNIPEVMAEGIGLCCWQAD